MKNIAIFASGSGTNAENIARLFHQGNRIRVAVVVSNKKNAGVHQRMEALGVPTLYLPNSVWDNDPAQVVDALRPYAPDLVVLAGFMRTIQPAIIDAYRGRMLNIHPSLLPAYGGKGMYGHHVHEAVMAAGEKQSGVTVHYVSDEIDGGEILMQQSVDIVPGDTAETLEAKIHPVEYSLYPRAIVAALQRLDNDGLPSSHAVEVSATPERAEAAHKAPEVPAAPPVPSADEEWAGVLQVKYSDSEARSAAERVSRQAQPPVPTQQPPAVPPRACRMVRGRSHIWPGL